jgi:hypothetical protein
VLTGAILSFIGGGWCVHSRRTFYGWLAMGAGAGLTVAALFLFMFWGWRDC